MSDPHQAQRHPPGTANVAASIRQMLGAELPADTVLANCVVIVETLQVREGREARKIRSYYPAGAPDQNTERGLLERALDKLLEDDNTG